MDDLEREAFKDDLRRRMKVRQVKVASGGMPIPIYVQACVDAMFDVAVEVLAEIKSEGGKK